MSVTKHSEDYRKGPKSFSIIYSELANNGVLIALAVCIDKLTSRLNLTKEEVNNCIAVDVLVEVSLSVVDELNHCLIGGRIELQRCNVGGLDVVSLEEHVNVLVSVNVAMRATENHRSGLV